MVIKERSWSSSSYRFGFNGQEQDNEMAGNGNSVVFKYRIHDPRLGRFLSVDPLSPNYPYWSPFAFAGNNPVVAIDLEGLEQVWYHKTLLSKNKQAWLRVIRTNRKTSGSKEFRNVLKKQTKIDVMYFSGYLSDDAWTLLVNDYDQYLRYKYQYVEQRVGVMRFKDMDDEKIKEFFQEEKKIMFIAVDKALLSKLQEAIDNEDKSAIKKLHIQLSHTVNHEEVAHGINNLKGVDKTEEKEHLEYNGEDNEYSPEIEDIDTDPKFRGTPAKEQLDEIKKIVNDD
jgi:RHS repeat-associated protein